MRDSQLAKQNVISLMMSTNNTTALPYGAVRAHALRLQPGDDLVSSLVNAATNSIASSPGAASAFVLSAVGSLSDVTIRLATVSQGRTNDVLRLTENVEVVSLVGTFTASGHKHVHISVANGKGSVFGGHLVAGTVFTTLELVFGTISNVSFQREMDARTGYTELVVSQRTADRDAQREDSNER